MSIIKSKKLTEFEVWQVVQEWYLNGMYSPIVLNEFGSELDEICDDYFYKIEFKKWKKDNNKQIKTNKNGKTKNSLLRWR